MDQQIIKWVIGAFGTLLGFLLNAVWQAVKDLEKADKELADKLSKIEVLVAGNYVKKDELDVRLDALFGKLDRIEDKLDKKVDKS